MAPEVLETNLKLEQPIDIFSLGCVFYEMLTGETRMMHQEIRQHESSAMKKIKNVLKNLNHCNEIIALTTSMLALNPKKRPNIDQVLQQLLKMKETKFAHQIQVMELQDKCALLEFELNKERKLRYALEEQLTKQRQPTE